jgi:hypothetical protein
LINSEIWATETPNTAGAISLSTRATPGCRRFSRQRGNIPMRARNGSWNASCSTPPANTAHASATTGGSNHGAANAAATMNATFSSTGVNAGIEKRFHVLRTPAASATSEMNRMYGKVILSIRTVSSNLPGSAANPGADT